MEDFAKELENFIFQGPTSLKKGTIVEGILVKLGEEWCFVDIGLKSEALIPAEELKGEDGSFFFSEGDRIKAVISGRDPDTGNPLLSFKELRKKELLKELNEAFSKNETVVVKPYQLVKGGYRVKYKGLVEGFLPFSQSYFRRRPERPEELLGKEISVKVINKDDRSVVFSYRKVAEEEFNYKKQELFKKLEAGEVVKGKVVKFVDGGYLVDIEGVVTGFLPLKETAWERILEPETYFSPGDEVEVKPIFFDPGKERLKLSRRAVLPDPWDGVEFKYSEGDKVKAKVVALQNFGAFVEIEPGVEALLPAGEIVWGRKVKPSEVLKVGDQVEVVVLELKPADRKFVVSLRRIEPSPWEKFFSQVKEGDVVKGKVVKVLDYGALVDLGENIKGFVHISNLSWKKVPGVSEVLKEGEECRFKVLKLDPKKQRVELSLKHLKPNPWEEFLSKYGVNDVVECKVMEVNEKGVKVEVVPELEGFIPAGEVMDVSNSLGPQKVKELLEKKFSPSDVIKAKVIEVNPKKKKLVLSYKKFIEDVEKKAVEEFLKGGKKGAFTLGEVLLKKLGGK